VQKTREGRFQWFLMNQLELQEAEVISNEKVVCIKADGKLGVCINNPSADGTCGCK